MGTRRVKTQAYRNWIETAKLEMIVTFRGQRPLDLSGQHQPCLDLFCGFGYDRDCSNAIKPVEDLLKRCGIVKDDRYVHRASAERATEPLMHPRLRAADPGEGEGADAADMAQLDEIRIAQFNATVRVWEKVLHELMLKPMLRRVEELIETWRVIEEGEEKTIGNGDNVLVADETNEALSNEKTIFQYRTTPPCCNAHEPRREVETHLRGIGHHG